MTSIGSAIVVSCIVTAFICVIFIKNEFKTDSLIANHNNVGCPFSSDEDDQAEFLRYSNDQNEERYSQNLNADRVETLFFSYLPQINCGTKVRLGGFGDGGKWVCNPWRLKENCTIYSVGLGINVQFDLEMLKKFNCKVYSFDPNPKYGMLLKIQTKNSSNFFYQPWYINGISQGSHKVTLTKAIGHYGHDTIDVLKIDAEGNEFEIFEEFFSVERETQICQLLIEIHSRAVVRWQRLFKILQNAGFLLYSREPNVYSILPTFDSFCVEYSYIHRNCLKKFGLFNVPLLTNFNE